MRNVSLDNPWWLLIAVPLLLAVVVPFIWAFRKENRTRAAVISLVLHVLIVAVIALAVAGTVLTTYMTRTEVIYIADVSYSSNRNLDLIDEHIASVNKKLPKNSTSSLICFGNDVEMLADFGEDLPSVSNYTVDDSGTNIAAALEYANTLFSNDAIKHVVLLTDGKDTSGSNTQLLQAVELLYANNVYIDVVYIDNNLEEDTTEVQISGVEASEATYLHHNATASVLVQSNTVLEATVRLYKNGVEYQQKPVVLSAGYNPISFDLDTTTVGSYDYEVVIEAEGDISSYNNSYGFTQYITGEMKILLISNNAADLEAVKQLYGDNVIIDAYINNPQVPCSVEALCTYDQIIVSGVDVSTLKNASSFIASVDQVVSRFGKTLINMGNGGIQDSESSIVADYQNLLPIKYGNSNEDPKLYVIVLDSSRSMFFVDKMKHAKIVAQNLLNVLNDEDMVMILGFSGEPRLISGVTAAANRNDLVRLIEQVGVTQGTVMGAALEEAYKLIDGMDFRDKQLMLISDGLSYSLEEDNPVDIAAKLYASGVTVSTVTIAAGDDTGTGQSMMNDIAASGHGEAYIVQSEQDAFDVAYTEISPDVGATVIEQDTKVTIKLQFDKTMDNVGTSLPNVLGFVQGRSKSDVTTVLTVPYQKLDGMVVDVPLYAYWAYGNGTVACFTSDLLGEWTSTWADTNGETFLKNIFGTTIPAERVDYPFALNVNFDGKSSMVEVIPSTIDAFAKLEMAITKPNGDRESQTLHFDRTRYYYEFNTPEIGKYSVDIIYSYGTERYEITTNFYIVRSPEYDSFVVFSAANLTSVIRDRGVVYEDNSLVVENNMDEVSTYQVDFTIALLAIAVSLYVIDIIIRKLTWADIRSLFKRRAK